MSLPPDGPDPAALEAITALGGTSFLAQLLDIYMKEGPERVVELERALAARDAHALSGVAHSLISSSAHLGATAAAETARSIERLANANAWETLPEEVRRLASLIAVACTSFRATRARL